MLDEKSAQLVTFYGHPPLPRYVGAMTWALFHHWFETIPAMRMGAILFFSGTVAILYQMVSKHEGMWAGLFASLGLACMPRILGQAFVLSSDIALLFCWLAASFVYLETRNHKWGGAVTGVSWGFLLITKFTAFLWIIPLFVYEIICERKIRFRFWITLILVSLLVAIMLNPTWWRHPWEGLWTHHIRLSLGRFNYLPITTYYLGHVGLPGWHYVLVMMAFTTPVAILFFFIVGLFTAMRRNSGGNFRMFCLVQFLTLLIVFSIPISPKYDGTRLFIVIFIWIAAMAGIGLRHAMEKWPGRKIGIIAFILLGICAIRAFQVHPFEFSYYNVLAGGARGAQKLGLESTYFWEAANPTFCDGLNKYLPAGSKVQVYPPYPDHFSFLQFAGYIRRDIEFTRDPARYLLLMTRQGQFTPMVWKIFTENLPVVKSVFEGVSLMQLYDVSDFKS